MRNKIWLIAAISILAGLAVIVGVLATVGFNFAGFSTLQFTEATVPLEGAEIHSIEIESEFFDVRIVPVQAGEAPALYHAACESYFHQIEVKDGKLTLRVVDNRVWYQKIGIFHVPDKLSKLELRIPAGNYQHLKIITASGDISATDPTFVFETAAVHTASGDTQLFATVGKECQVSSASGDIEIRNVTGGPIYASAVSGDVEISDCTPRNLTISSTSGEITLSRILMEEATSRLESGSGDIQLNDVVGGIGSVLQINTTSGDIDLKACDAGGIAIDTTSGEVELSLLSGKSFEIKSTSGDLNYPPSDSTGGTCSVKTTSGDVDIRVISGAE